MWVGPFERKGRRTGKWMWRGYAGSGNRKGPFGPLRARQSEAYQDALALRGAAAEVAAMPTATIGHGVDKLISDFEAKVARGEGSPATLAGYRSRRKTFFGDSAIENSWILNPTELAIRFTVQDTEDALTLRQKECGTTSNTRRDDLVWLRMVFRAAGIRDDDNPARLIRLPRRQPIAKIWCTSDQIRLVLEKVAASSDPDAEKLHDTVLFLALTGARAGHTPAKRGAAAIEGRVQSAETEASSLRPPNVVFGPEGPTLTFHRKSGGERSAWFGPRATGLFRRMIERAGENGRLIGTKDEITKTFERVREIVGADDELEFVRLGFTGRIMRRSCRTGLREVGLGDYLCDEQLAHGPLGRKLLARVATIVTPDTILRWHRKLIAARWTFPSERRRGRPGIMKEIRELIVRMARDNKSWGYCRIQGELKKLGHRVARSTIAKTLKDDGIRPSTERPSSWRTFLRSHADVIAGADFFTAEVWTARGLVTHYLLFVLHHATRVIQIAGITTNPDANLMARVARNLTVHVDGLLRHRHYLIVDRDSKFTAYFGEILERAGVRLVRISRGVPDMNAIAERWVRSVKSECLNRLVLFGERSLHRALRAYGAHYHHDRPHQGLGNELICPTSADRATATGEVIETERLGGLLRSYRRAAA